MAAVQIIPCPERIHRRVISSPAHRKGRGRHLLLQQGHQETRLHHHASLHRPGRQHRRHRNGPAPNLRVPTTGDDPAIRLQGSSPHQEVQQARRVAHPREVQQARHEVLPREALRALHVAHLPGVPQAPHEVVAQVAAGQALQVEETDKHQVCELPVKHITTSRHPNTGSCREVFLLQLFMSKSR